MNGLLTGAGPSGQLTSSSQASQLLLCTTVHNMLSPCCLLQPRVLEHARHGVLMTSTDVSQEPFRETPLPECCPNLALGKLGHQNWQHWRSAPGSSRLACSDHHTCLLPRLLLPRFFHCSQPTVSLVSQVGNTEVGGLEDSDQHHNCTINNNELSPHCS